LHIGFKINYYDPNDYGKPCTGKPYARFDEGGLVKLSMKWLLRHRQTKGAETDRPFLQMICIRSFMDQAVPN